MVQPWYTKGETFMPTVQRRVSPNGKVSYRALVRLKGHKAKTATFLKRADAVTWAQETETKVKQSKYFPDRLIESEKYTLTDLLNRYKSDVLPDKRDKNQLGQLDWWKVQLGEYKLKDLTPSLIASLRDKLTKELSKRTGRTRTPATVNRYLALLSHACTTAIKEWQWMAVNPVIQISKPKEAQGRTRFLNDEEREKLLVVCRSSKSTYLFTIVTLALSTGMRRGEILGLSWENVDLKNSRITLFRTKNGERRVVPFNDEKLIESQRLNITQEEFVEACKHLVATNCKLYTGSNIVAILINQIKKYRKEQDNKRGIPNNIKPKPTPHFYLLSYFDLTTILKKTFRKRDQHPINVNGCAKITM